MEKNVNRANNTEYKYHANNSGKNTRCGCIHTANIDVTSLADKYTYMQSH